MILPYCTVLLFVLFILPFMPGLFEFWRKDDAAPLFINMDYCKDPRYFALSFRRLFLDWLYKHGDPEGLWSSKMSRRDLVEIVDSSLIPDDTILRNLYYVKNGLNSGRSVVFKKEVYVRGPARIGESNQMRALACDGDVQLLEGVKFSRWLDAQGSIKTSEMCDLGISATCSRELFLAPKCLFKRLYGFPVVVGLSPGYMKLDKLDGGADGAFEAAATYSQSYYVEEGKITISQGKTERNITHIDAHCRKECNIITANSLIIGDHAVIRGDVKTHKSITMGAWVFVEGNIFAEGDIQLGAHSCILGTVFTQGRVICEEGVTIGSEKRIKSVVAKKGIILQHGVEIYGYVMTEGDGVVI